MKKQEQIKICFIGKMRSGKSEAINYLKKKYDVEVVDFGDSLKEVIKIVYPRKCGKPRALLQQVGQHMRKLDEDIWLYSVDKKINNSDKKIIACASCRQQNEYDYLNKMAFLFIKVVCKDSLRIKRAEDAGDSFDLKDFIHETEVQIDNFDCQYVLYNDEDLKSFHEQIDNIMEHITKGE